MKQVTLHIPDNEFDFFMELVKKFKYKTAETAIYSIPEEVKKLVEDRRKSAKSTDYLTTAESNLKLKKKYGI